MKWIYIFLFAIFLQGISSLHAQITTSGTDFWLTYGKNWRTSQDDGELELQIRIVSRDQPTSGIIYFTELGTSVPFNIPAQQVFTYKLTELQIGAAYNTSGNVTSKSIHITSNQPITSYALNQFRMSTDATNLLPVTALGTDYYQISYIPRTEDDFDAYAVVATENNTQVYQNNSVTPVATLNAGQVYYRTSPADMTGEHITTDKPVAFFALNQGVMIPENSGSADCLMQQLAPVNTWGKTFFVPVSDLTTEDSWPPTTNTKDRVRIVASQDNTVIIPPKGATLITNTGGASKFTINKGQFIELEVTLNNSGCYIESDQPIGACTFLTSRDDNNGHFSDPSQAWLPSIAQAVSEALIAPFIPTGITELNAHYALIITPTNFKEETTVSIGGAPAIGLKDGKWRDHTEAGFSFYNMLLTDQSSSYLFANQKGLIAMCYGTGDAESYYYLAYSGMRNLQTAFYANDIHYQDLQTRFFCEGDVAFRAEAKGMSNKPGHLKWYIDDVEEIDARDMLEWGKFFFAGDYNVKMIVRSFDEDSVTIESTLHIDYEILAVASPPEGGYVEGTGCYRPDAKVVLTATPNLHYYFVNWTEEGVEVSTEASYFFIATKSRSLVANFAKIIHTVNVEVNEPDYGFTTGAGNYAEATYAQLEAFVNSCYRFNNWTIDGVVVSTDNPYIFTVTESVNIVANFYALDFDTYSPTLWDNTFLLNLLLLREDGYEYTGCKWFKNGIELKETHTINEFSYSAGPNDGDLLELAPTYYMFQLITNNFGTLCSSKKLLTEYQFEGSGNLLAYPNPVLSGIPFTIEGVSKENQIYVYNCFGACVYNTVATEKEVKLSLSLSAGIYLIRSNNKRVKIVVFE
jgi:hypothetical protein